MPPPTERIHPERAKPGEREPSSFRILVADTLSPEALQPLRDYGFHVDYNPQITPDELQSSIGTYHGLVVRSRTRVTADVLNAAQNLQIVVRPGVDVSRIDVNTATERGILVVNTPEGNTNSAAEMAITLMLAAARDIPRGQRDLEEGKWEPLMGMEVEGKTFGVLALGHVGMAAAKKTRGLGMKVIAFDPFANRDMAEQAGIELVERDDVLRESDVVSMHLPLNADTFHSFGRRDLEKMKPTAILVNTSRGEVLDEEALADALDNGIIAKAALDVWEHEPDINPRLRNHDKIIKSPHKGAQTLEANTRVAEDAVKQLISFFEGRPTEGAINAVKISPEILASLDNYPEVAQKMAAFAFALSPNKRITEVDVEYSGGLSDVDTSLLQASIVSGLFSAITTDRINPVNWKQVAQKRGLTVREHRNPKVEANQANLIKLRLQHEEGEIEVSAEQGRTGPRIVGIDQFLVEFQLEGNMLVIKNRDVPGAVHYVTGKLLELEEANIANISLAQDGAGNALMVFSLEDPITEKQAEYVRIGNEDTILTSTSITI